MSGFVHLHAHTTWSLLDGAIPAEALPHAAAILGYEAVAMTDHDSLLGAVRFTQACREAGVKPLYGAELTLEDARTGGHHVTVLARNATGYANLCRLITQAHLSHERGDPSVTPQALASRAEGLFVLSGCKRSEVATLAAAGAIPQAIAAARRWREAIGDGYRLEVFDQRGYGDRALRDRLLKVAREADVVPVATNDVHYAVPDHAVTHELLHAIGDIVPLSKTHALRNNSEYYLKDPEQMRALFADAPEVADETLRIAEACDFELDLGTYHFPHVAMPAGETPTGRLARLCYEGARRRYGRVPCAVEDRLQHELQLIFRMGFAAYFLLVADIVHHVRNVLGIRCACRGSAAGSLVCYVLGISDVDPVRYDLLFERFMNTRREELPDIDVDVESHRREEVLDHILQTYGADQTAVCCMVDTFRARMAIREVGKALGVASDEIDLVAKAFPRVRASDIPKALERLPELRGSNLDSGQLERLFELAQEIDGFPRHLALHPSGVVLSSPDLGDRVPMQESFQGFTMLQADKDDVEALGLVKLDVLGVRMLSSISHAVCEIERHDAELDIDAIPRDDDATYELICSSRTLGCFQIESPGQRELLARLQPNRFEDLIVDISLFRPGPVQSDMVSPYLDRRHGFQEVVYPHPSLKPILRETHGVVVFHEQLIRVIAQATGCSLDDADHIRRHLDEARPAAADDPTSRPGRWDATAKTDTSSSEVSDNGQTTVRQLSDGSGRGHLAWPGSPREADPDWYAASMATSNPLDQPRKVKSWDTEIGAWFRSRSEQRGFTPQQALALWKEVFAFASFGFCKSHAAAFALPTYISSWIKAHYPAEFFAGILTHDPGMYPRRLIVADARRFGIPILPIDVNRSDAVYRVEPAGDARGVRLALTEVRDISESETSSIVAARREGPFVSLEDLWRRAEVSRPVLENLIHVGAFDGIESRSRRELLWRAVELSDGHHVAPRRKRTRAVPGSNAAPEQLSLSLDEPISPELSELPGYTPLEETEAELEISGMDARRHLMALYEPLVAEVGCVPAADLGKQRNDSRVWVAGVKVASQTPAIRSGQRIIFVTLDDLTGPIDVTVFERVQARCAHTVFHSWLLLVRGVVRKRGGASLVHPTDPGNIGVTVVVDEVYDLAELSADRNAGHSLNAALTRQRRKQFARAPAGAVKAPARLWHSSGGSAGR